MKKLSGLIAIISLSIVAGCHQDPGSSHLTRQCRGERWIGAWAAAPSDAETALTNQNLRLILTPLRGGDEVRILFSNRLSASPIRIASAYLGKHESGPRLVSGSNTPLYFQGSTEVTISPGEEVYSDSVPFSFEAFEKLAISLFLRGKSTSVTAHDSAMQTSYLSEPGASPFAADENGEGFTQKSTSRPIVMGVDVMAPASHSVVAAIGDSITDGFQSNADFSVHSIDTDTRYPDFLARRLRDEASDVSVINLGIGGNRILEDGVFPTSGPSLLKRLEDDLLARDDVSNVIILEGINDLGINPALPAEKIIKGLEEAVAIIKTRGADLPPIKVFVGTILPAGATALPLGVLYRITESRRQEVNQYIRTSGIGDGYIDFDEAVASVTDPTLLATDYDGGDGLHPSSKGYAQMARKVNLSELRHGVCSQD